MKVAVNQGTEKDPKLFFLDFVGKGGRAARLKVVGAPNLCPHCGKVPMVCPGCGHNNWPERDYCRQPTLFLPDAPENSHPNGFTVTGYPPEVEIVEAKDWDGSDCFMAGSGSGTHFVTDRVREWIGELDAYPITFKPALLNIAGVEEKFGIK